MSGDRSSTCPEGTDITAIGSEFRETIGGSRGEIFECPAFQYDSSMNLILNVRHVTPPARRGVLFRF
jgi:hypothetical protein